MGSVFHILMLVKIAAMEKKYNLGKNTSPQIIPSMLYL